MKNLKVVMAESKDNREYAKLIGALKELEGQKVDKAEVKAMAIAIAEMLVEDGMTFEEAMAKYKADKEIERIVETVKENTLEFVPTVWKGKRIYFNSRNRELVVYLDLATMELYTNDIKAAEFLKEILAIEVIRDLDGNVLNAVEEVVAEEKAEDLKEVYANWRKITEELNGSVDCGAKAVREDFSAYAGLEEEITFEEMLELERDYDNNN